MFRSTRALFKNNLGNKPAAAEYRYDHEHNLYMVVSKKEVLEDDRLREFDSERVWQNYNKGG